MAMYKTFKTMAGDTNEHFTPASTQQQQSVPIDIPRVASLNHRKQLINQNMLVVIDNYTDWCGPCKQCAPQFAQLAAKYGRPGMCVMVKENIEDGHGGQPVAVRGVPCFHFYVNGQFMGDDTVVGADIGEVEKVVQRVLTSVQ